MMRPRALLRLLAALLTLLVVSAACGSTAEEPFMSGLPETEATDDGDSGGGDDQTDPDCDDDNARPSLEPTEELTGPGQFAAGSYMAEIRDRGVLRAGVGADTLLFGYLDPQLGDIVGFDVEIARLVAAAIFGNPDQVELIPIQSAERIERLQNGDVDLVVKTMTINCERWASIDFSTVYYEAGQRLLLGEQSDAESVEELTDEVVCAVSGTTSLRNLTDAGVDTIEAVTWTDCLVEFQQGRADGISTDDAILAGLVDQDPLARVVGPRFSEEPYGVGLPKEHPEFTRFVNAVLEQARTDGTWADLYELWLADVLSPGEPIPSPPPADYRP